MTHFPASYTGWSAAEKLRWLTEQAEATRYTALPHEARFPFLLRRLPGLLDRARLNQSFAPIGDEMLRPRLIHAYGVTAPCVWESAAGHPFSGVLATGGACFARYSMIVPGGRFITGMAYKLLRDGASSVNAMAFNSFDGQGDNHEFFHEPSSTHLDMPRNKDWFFRLLELLLTPAVAELARPLVAPLALPSHHLATARIDGTVEAHPVVPHRIWFTPGDARTGRDPREDIRVKLARLEPGVVLHQVWASPAEGQEQVRIGCVRLTGRFVASSFGDARVRFGHDWGPATADGRWVDGG